MEFFFELFFEVFGEVFVQMLFSALAEAGLHVLRNPDQVPRERSPWLLVLGYATLGAIVGIVSLVLFRHSFIHNHWGRLANLVLSPVAGGLGMAILGAWRRRRGQQTIQLDRFAYGFIFALAMSLIRYFGAA